MTKVKLGDVAIEYKQAYQGNRENVPNIGLEHLISGEVKLSCWDTDNDNTFTKRFNKGQVLLGRRRAYLKKAVVAPFDGICSGDITIIEAIPNKILPELLPFIIQNNKFFDYAVKGSAGSLSPRVKWEYLKEYEFDLPPIEEQERLAELLWAAYDLKESYKKLIAATDEMVKGKFIEMFGDISKYQLLKIEDICETFIDGDWIESKDQSASGIRLIQTGNIGCGYYVDKEDKARYISDQTFRKLNCSEVKPNDILISRLPDPIGRACIVPDGLGKSITAVDCTIVRLATICLPEYFIAFTNTPLYRKKIAAYTAGSTRQRISRKNLGAITLPCPSTKEQNVFIEITKQADKSKMELQQSIEHIDNVIKSLLP